MCHGPVEKRWFGQDRDRGRASIGVRPGNCRRVVVGAEHAFGRRSPFTFGNDVDVFGRPQRAVEPDQARWQRCRTPGEDGQRFPFLTDFDDSTRRRNNRGQQVRRRTIAG